MVTEEPLLLLHDVSNAIAVQTAAIIIEDFWFMFLSFKSLGLWLRLAPGQIAFAKTLTAAQVAAVAPAAIHRRTSI